MIARQHPGMSNGSAAARQGGISQDLVYLAGQPRTPTIEASLAASKLPLVVLDCYQMTEISYSTDIIFSDILSPPADLVLLYSANAARRFCSLVGSKEHGSALDSTRFGCLSAMIAAELPESWQPRIITANHPNEDSLLASLAALG